MTFPTLHILNGDATLQGFQDAGIDGDVIVWREALSEGPVTGNVASAEFWRERLAWVCKTFDETPANYEAGMVAQLERLSEPYEEINLWFEYDLHCQVNLLAVMMLLEQQTNLSAPEVYLISPASFSGKEQFNGMGELTGEELAYLCDNIRVQLGDYDFALAIEAWQLYVAKDPAKLEAWLQATTFWGNMPNLQPAMHAHLKRLQTDDDGFNYIHHVLLEKFKSGLTNRAALYASFWQTESIYGIGDSQLDIYLQQLIDRGLVKLD